MSDTRPRLRRQNRRISPLAGLTAAAAICAGLLIATHSAQQQAQARETADITASAPTPSPSTPLSSASPVTWPSAATAPSASVAEQATKAGATTIGVAKAPITVSYLFDGGARQPVMDGSAAHPMAPDAANGGAILYTPRADGWAIGFPDRCTTTASRCPRVILQGVRDDTLNPGTRTFRFGAAIMMTKDDTGPGANVVQKGYSVGGVTQFKLQVDGRPGKPSCVIASTVRIYKVIGPRSIADGTWHSVVCTRSGGTLSMTVDGADAGSRSIPASLSVANPEPLRIGGKGTTVNNDQYAGEIDNVFLSIL